MPHPHLSDSIPKWQKGQFRDGRAPDDGDLVVLRPEGLYCPAGDFFIDPWQPVDRAVITHAHGDHARVGNRHYLAAARSEGVLRSRLLIHGTFHDALRGSQLFASWRLIGVAYLAVLIGRAAVVSLVVALGRRTRERMPW